MRDETTTLRAPIRCLFGFIKLHVIVYFSKVSLCLYFIHFTPDSVLWNPIVSPIISRLFLSSLASFSFFLGMRFSLYMGKCCVVTKYRAITFMVPAACDQMCFQIVEVMLQE